MNRPVVAQENVFGLEVAINDAVLVQVLQRREDLGGVKHDARCDRTTTTTTTSFFESTSSRDSTTTLTFAKALFALQVMKELAAVDKFHNEDELVVGLKSEPGRKFKQTNKQNRPPSNDRYEKTRFIRNG